MQHLAANTKGPKLPQEVQFTLFLVDSICVASPVQFVVQLNTEVFAFLFLSDNGNTVWPIPGSLKIHILFLVHIQDEMIVLILCGSWVLCSQSILLPPKLQNHLSILQKLYFILLPAFSKWQWIDWSRCIMVSSTPTTQQLANSSGSWKAIVCLLRWANKCLSWTFII